MYHATRLAPLFYMILQEESPRKAIRMASAETATNIWWLRRYWSLLEPEEDESSKDY